MSTERKPTGGFDQALRWVGDLDHPFYKDERQRYIWYEASAIGFQLLLLSHLVIGGLAMIILGRDGVPYMLIGMVPVMITTLVVLTYTNQRGAQYFVQPSDLGRSRGLLGLGVVVLWVAGLARVGVEAAGSGDDSGFDQGLLVGAVAGLVGGVGALLWAKRRHRLAEAAQEDD